MAVLLAAALLAGLVPSSASARPPRFSEGGFLLSLQYGGGGWDVPKAPLAAQVGEELAQTFVSDLSNGHTLSLRAAYTVLGHASLSLDVTGTGWELDTLHRGGAGFFVGAVSWHPLEMVFKLLQYEARPVDFDVSTFFGMGYGIAGERLAADGMVFEWGAQFDWFFSRFFAVGTFARGVFLNWNNFYLDYSRKTEPGATLPLSHRIGGSFWTLGVSVSLRAGD